MRSTDSIPTIATAALTRGYPLRSAHNYRFILRRNRSILRILSAHSGNVKLDNVLFHEGNIGWLTRFFIRMASWPLRLRFVNLSAFFNQFEHEANPDASKMCPQTELSSRFSLGYRAMCALWVNEFLAYLGEYDVVFRLDEDCVLEGLNFDTVLRPMLRGEIDYVAGMAFGNDAPDVTCGFVDFVTNWHQDHPSTNKPVFDNNPYTNLFIFRPESLKGEPRAIQFLQDVRATGCILNNRWGDHVVWGALLSMMSETIKSDLNAEIRYFHGSHRMRVLGRQSGPLGPDSKVAEAKRKR